MRTDGHRSAGHRYGLFLILLTISVFFFSFSCFAIGDVPEEVISSTDSVVRILSEYVDGYATGSGFVVSNYDGTTYVVTNYHVVEGNPYSVSIWIDEENTISASIAIYTDQKDMAVLKLNQSTNLKPLTLCTKTAVRGEAVYAVGFPGSADYLSDTEAHTSEEATITDGIISAVRDATLSEYGATTELLQINAAINSGNSGGPLLNTLGEVVGINTYGIEDSQGIFGSISVKELITFLRTHDIPFSVESSAGRFSLTVVLIAVGIAVAAAVAVLVVCFAMAKKRRNKSQSPNMKDNMEQKMTEALSLRDYIASKQCLSAEEATSLLMPVLLKVRDIHNDGRVHLQISPDSVMIEKGSAYLIDASANEALRYTSGFAAPEVYSGRGTTRSDVYSSCAAIFYAVTGVAPENALARNGSISFTDSQCGADYNGNQVTNDSLGPCDECTNVTDSLDDVSVGKNDSDHLELPEAFKDIITSGMALSDADRLDGMQALIHALSPYNTGIIPDFASKTDGEYQTDLCSAPKKASRHKKGVIIGAISAAVVVICVGLYFGTYLETVSKAKSGDFSSASKYLLFPSVTAMHNDSIVSYINAGLDFENMDYKSAADEFSKTIPYLDSDYLHNESNYRLAAQKADNNEFSEAKRLYSTLAEMNYSDAAEKLTETKY